MWRLAVIWIAFATTAHAGAWPREEGGWFLSFGGNAALFEDAESPVYYDPTIYIEYGLTPRLTLGLDGYTADRLAAASGFAFARLALTEPGAPLQWAVSAGSGAVMTPDGMVEPAVRTGAHWGLGREGGWLALDAQSVLRLHSRQREAKIDATWGWRFAEDWAAVTGAEIGIGLQGDVYAKASPSLVWSPTDRFSLRLGAVQALTGDRGTALLLQTWLEF